MWNGRLTKDIALVFAGCGAERSALILHLRLHLSGPMLRKGYSVHKCLVSESSGTYYWSQDEEMNLPV